MSRESDFFPWELSNKTSNHIIIVNNEHLIKLRPISTNYIVYNYIKSNEVHCFISSSMFAILACLPAGAHVEKETPTTHCEIFYFFSQLQGTPVATSLTAAVDDGLGLQVSALLTQRKWITAQRICNIFGITGFLFFLAAYVLLGCFSFLCSVTVNVMYFTTIILLPHCLEMFETVLHINSPIPVCRPWNHSLSVSSGSVTKMRCHQV